MESKLAKYIPKKNQWVVLLLVGILLVVIAIPTDNSTDSDSIINYGTSEISTTDTEKRLENLLEQMQGIGDVHVMITYQQDDVVEGIVIVADGGGNSIVVRSITEVVQALFEVDSHKIKVIEKKTK